MGVPFRKHTKHTPVRPQGNLESVLSRHVPEGQTAGNGDIRRFRRVPYHRYRVRPMLYTIRHAAVAYDEEALPGDRVCSGVTYRWNGCKGRASLEWKNE